MTWSGSLQRSEKTMDSTGRNLVFQMDSMQPWLPTHLTQNHETTPALKKPDRILRPPPTLAYLSGRLYQVTEDKHRRNNAHYPERLASSYR